MHCGGNPARLHGKEDSRRLRRHGSSRPQEGDRRKAAAGHALCPWSHTLAGNFQLPRRLSRRVSPAQGRNLPRSRGERRRGDSRGAWRDGRGNARRKGHRRPLGRSSREIAFGRSRRRLQDTGVLSVDLLGKSRSGALAVASRNILGKLGLKSAELRKTTPLSFACRCSPDRATAMLAALSPEERAALPPTIDITCHMCGRTFTVNTRQTS